jgi:hypothetical protein
MALHAPPCSGNEVLIGDVCYPRPDAMQVVPVGGSFHVVIGGAAPELLPLIAEVTGTSSHMLVSKSGSAVNVTITSVQRDEADELTRRLMSDSANDDFTE